MVYHKPHLDCSENKCQSYSAYIRVQKKWIKAGEYNSECHTFTPDEDVKTFDEIKQEIRRNSIQRWVEQILDDLKKIWGIDSNV